MQIFLIHLNHFPDIPLPFQLTLKPPYKQNKRTIKDNKRMIDDEFYFETFSDERDLEPIIKLVEQDLSEPYSIYTYRDRKSVV